MAARTAAPDAPAAPHVSPARDPAGPPSPVLAWPSEWPVPVLPEPASRARRRADRGLPMAPTLAAAGNATTLLATGAYEAGGVVGLAASGVVAAAGATAAVVRRRKTVRRNMAARNDNRSAANWPRSGGGGGGRGSSLLSPFGRGTGGSRNGGGSGSGGSGYRAPGRSGGSLLGSGGRGPGGTGGGKNTPSARTGAGSLDLSKTPKKKDHAKKKHKNHGLAAALGRTTRAATKTGSKPRKALAAVGHGTVAATQATGRGLKKAMTADGTKKATRATRAGAKKLRGVATDGVRSIVAAAWTGLRKKDRKAALARLKETWTKRRQKRADKEAAKKAKTAEATPETATVATSVRRPTATSSTPASTGGTIMPGHHFTAPAMEMARIAANYQPTGMLQVGEDFSGLEEALRLTAEAMKVTVENADATQPLAPQIIEIMRQVHGLQLKAAELASELRPAFENLHQVDLERLRNPRKGVAGERMWDVTTNLS